MYNDNTEKPTLTVAQFIAKLEAEVGFVLRCSEIAEAVETIATESEE